MRGSWWWWYLGSGPGFLAAQLGHPVEGGEAPEEGVQRVDIEERVVALDDAQVERELPVCC